MRHSETTSRQSAFLKIHMPVGQSFSFLISFPPSVTIWKNPIDIATFSRPVRSNPKPTAATSASNRRCPQAWQKTTATPLVVVYQQTTTTMRCWTTRCWTKTAPRTSSEEKMTSTSKSRNCSHGVKATTKKTKKAARISAWVE